MQELNISMVSQVSDGRITTSIISTNIDVKSILRLQASPPPDPTSLSRSALKTSATIWTGF